MLGKKERSVDFADEAVVDFYFLFTASVLALDSFVVKEKGENEEVCPDDSLRINLREIFLLAIATSIDALAIGITFAFLQVRLITSVTIIGCITFCFSIAGVLIGNVFGSKFKDKATILGGIILIGIGVKILIEHLEIFG